MLIDIISQYSNAAWSTIILVLYEVNLTINNEIYDDYYRWLILHMDEMLRFRGFKKAMVSKDHAYEDKPVAKLVVHYTVATEDDLNEYLKNHAATMRQESINKFGDKFSATRRVLLTAYTLG